MSNSYMTEYILLKLQYFFLEYQCLIRKRYSKQYRLLAMIEKMKETHDNNKVYTAVHINFSKIFDRLPHNLIRFFDYHPF